MLEQFSHLSESLCDQGRGVYRESQNRGDGYWYWLDHYMKSLPLDIRIFTSKGLGHTWKEFRSRTKLSMDLQADHSLPAVIMGRIQPPGAVEWYSAQLPNYSKCREHVKSVDRRRVDSKVGYLVIGNIRFSPHLPTYASTGGRKGWRIGEIENEATDIL